MGDMKPQRDTATGKFRSDSEPNKSKLTLRLPSSLYDQLREVAGDQVAAWVREAIAEKLQRQKNQQAS